MPDTNRGHTDAGSATQSDTASQVSAADPTTSNSQNQIQSTGSGEIRYAKGYRGGPPNHGFMHGVYTNPDTGKQYFLPEAPRLDGSNGPPQISPFVPIYEYNGPTAPLGPAIYLKSEFESHQVLGSPLNPINASNSGSGSGSGNQHGSGLPNNQIAETRLTLTRNGRVFRPLVSLVDVNNDTDQPD